MHLRIAANKSVPTHLRAAGRLFPKHSADELDARARSLFSAVHGMVALSLEQKPVAVPIRALRHEISAIVCAMVKGLVAQSVA
jgi:hypothetical protein